MNNTDKATALRSLPITYSGYMAHATHARKEKLDDNCRLCARWGAVRMPWDSIPLADLHPDHARAEARRAPASVTRHFGLLG